MNRYAWLILMIHRSLIGLLLNSNFPLRDGVENSKRSIRQITISNLGVIAATSIELGDGFNVLTGETGAGKTMILTALGLLAGEKADSDFIRSGADKLSVSAILHLEGNPSETLDHLIAEQDPEMDQGELVISRSVSRDGKNRAGVGGAVATAGVVAKFASEFYAIHGQGSNQKLLSNVYQRKLIDQSEEELRKSCENLRHGVLELRNRLSQIVKRIALKPDEYAIMQSRIEQLDSLEQWQQALSGALNALDDEEGGAISSVSQAHRALHQLDQENETVNLLSNRLSSAKSELNDLRSEISRLLSDLTSEPGELDRLRERKAAILAFVKKNSDLTASGSSLDEQIQSLIDYADSVDQLLANIEGGDERLIEMEKELREFFDELMKVGESVSKLRKMSANRIEEKICDELAGLGLAGATFSIDISTVNVAKPEDFPLEGLDEVTFKFASHQSITPLPLNKGISGGELSRLMLAIELALVSRGELFAIIFDEVDTGIGGETANVVGERLAKLSENHQIIVVTHLPQVAVWAQHHYVITKSADGDFVQSSVQKVKGDVRVREVARMLSGEVENKAALVHARSLLEHASSL
ncbi:MAG: DNA repair protein RecN [Actinobacteria bacterium]|nr:DNA repair protein RecN [Actinomycetota bacterium]